MINTINPAARTYKAVETVACTQSRYKTVSYGEHQNLKVTRAGKGLESYVGQAKR